MFNLIFILINDKINISLYNKKETSMKTAILILMLCLFAMTSVFAANIKDFGAIADEKTDISDSINAAIKIAIAEGSNLVTIPEGRYLLEKPITMPDGLTIKGAGRRNTVINITKHDFVPFTFSNACRIEGLAFTYPNNQETINPKKAEPTILLTGINPQIEQVTFSGAWICVSTPEKETNAGGALFRDIDGWSHYRGFVISGAKDINKFENIHWFVGGTEVSDKAFYAKNRVCFDFTNVDGVMMSKCFTILSKTFFQQNGSKKNAEGKVEASHSLPHYIDNCWIEHTDNGFIFAGNGGFVIDSTQILVRPGGTGITVKNDAIFYNAAITSTQVRGTGGGNIIGLIYDPQDFHVRTKLSVSDFQVVDGYPAIKLGKKARNFSMLNSHLMGSGGIEIADGADSIIIQDNIIDYWPGGYSIKNNNKLSKTVIIKDNIIKKLK